MREHDPRLDEIDCRSAKRDLSLLVDLECDDACRSRLEHHLAGCPDCRELFLSERRLKAKLSSSCCGPVAR
jgi:predicted anti-sigma-YlaC factor YlaD